jgi:hypothetical protein
VEQAIPFELGVSHGREQVKRGVVVSVNFGDDLGRAAGFGDFVRDLE